jgi:hypothetical protein
MISEISSMDLWAGIFLTFEYWKRPNIMPAMQIKNPIISQLFWAALRTGIFSSASLASKGDANKAERRAKTLRLKIMDVLRMIFHLLLIIRKKRYDTHGKTAHKSWRS